MYERDYLMRIVATLAEAVRRSWLRAKDERDPLGSAEMLEAAIGEATEIDGATLLALAPESMAAILQVSGTDPRVMEYVARSLLLAAYYLREAGQSSVADLRWAQAQALIDAYGLDVPNDVEELAKPAIDVEE